MKLFKKKTSVQNDDWEYWDFYDEDDYYGLNLIDKTYFDSNNQKGYKKEYYIKILIPEQKMVQGKFPSPDTNKELQSIEDILISDLEKLKIDCKQVHRCTYFGAKRMLFEVADIKSFDNSISNWQKHINDYKLEVIEDKAWAIYNEVLPDKYDWQQIGNRGVYENLINAGTNPKNIHLIEHAIFGNLADLKKLENELHKEGGKTLNFEKNMLEIAFESVLEMDEINGMTYFLIDKSEEFNCRYDGWSSAIMK